jgi:outer membrane protein
LQGDLNIWSGFQQINTIKKNKLNFQKAQFDADYYKDDISISVASEYLQTLFFLEFVEMARNQLEITNQQVDRTQKLVEAGTLAKGDLLTIEAQQASEELSLVEADNSLALSYLNLSQLMELRTPEGFQIEKPELGLIESPELFKPDKLFTTAVDIRPEIRSAEMGVESSEMDLKIARGAYYPRLYLSGSLGSGYSGANLVGNDFFYEEKELGYFYTGDPANPVNPVYTVQGGYQSYDPKPFGDQLNDNLNQTMNLSLNIPIFNGWSARSNVAQAKIGVENANLDLELQKKNLYKILQQAYNDALSAFNKYNAAQKKVNATSESFKYAEQKFNVGLINSVEYNDAKKESNNALSELIQAKFDYVFRVTVIDFYLGKPLTFNR